MLLLLLLIGGGGVLALAYMALRGPSASKALKRRMELVKERHGDIIAGNAQAQIRKLMAERASKIEGFATTLIPKPALLRKRLEMTGRDITLGKYAMVTLGIALVIATLLMMKGMPFLLGIFLGLFVGIGLPHWVVGKMINPRQITPYLPSVMSLPVISSRLRSSAGFGIRVEA